ncbi:metalloregulator ArsR/SmtB family transcription factor [Achromobacter sp.]|uniref:ArsR/SmtB family transcription factor n=1 Tax=Achromobacter sp. TaxID=134375 RepID=UPI00258399DA|nr:metalloregulator ArsR/SmtB family transcription factor [Achromobacter sp.]
MAIASMPSPAVASHFNADLPRDGMTFKHALSAFHALSQPTRLEIFRLLMAREPEGAPAGLIAEMVEGPHNTVSQHLSVLARAGLIRGDRQGRSIIYRADVGVMGTLMSFMLTDCCHGHPEACAPVIAALAGHCDCDVVVSKKSSNPKKKKT